MTTGIVQDHNLEKQMGCMAGFLQIFDRHQILTGRRLHSTKRLPLSSGADSATETESVAESPAISREFEKPHQARTAPSAPSPDRLKQSTPMELRSPAPEPATPVMIQPKLHLPLPISEFKEGTRSSWKFSREAPRLSLDSRAIIDAKGSIYPREIRTNASILAANRSSTSQLEEADDGDKQHRSPSVIARLMGLEPLTPSDPEPVKISELRRSSSESRVSKEFYQYRFVDGNNFQQRQSQQSNLQSNITSSVVMNNAGKVERSSDARVTDPKDLAARNVRVEPMKASNRGMGQRKSFFDSAEVFREPKQTVSLYGEIEKRLKKRGIDEPSKDVETLKQILDALQLRGLLHSKKLPSQMNYRNIVYDWTWSQTESPIVVMRPARSPIPANRSGRTGNYSPPTCFRSRPGARWGVNVAGENTPAVSSRRERPENDRNTQGQRRGRNSSSPTRSECSVRSPSRKGGPLKIETQRRGSDASEQRRVSPVQSPKISPRRTGTDPQMTNRSPRNRKSTAQIYSRDTKRWTSQAEDELSTISESSISTSSQTDTERSNKVGEYQEGRNLLERCDKLLHSIAEMTATELQPSPVSVLDTSFYKDESSPSPVLKRKLYSKDQAVEIEDDIWSRAISFVESDDCDFVYISDILHASNYLPEDSDIFLLLEKQQYLKGKDTSKVTRLQRKLIFDTINEILDRNRQLPPWKSISRSDSAVGKTSLEQIWSEIKHIQERDVSEDLFEIICGVLKKDLAGDSITGWGDWPNEMSQIVLDIERLIFKDLIGETIRDLAALSGKFCIDASAPRRKLVF